VTLDVYRKTNTEMAGEYGAKLYPAHVIPIQSYLMGDPKMVDNLRKAQQDADSNLASILDSASNRGIPSHALVDNGDVWGILSSFIKQYSVKLLVISTTGRTGLRKVLIGSVAEEVIRESPCPVLTVGPKAPSDENIRLQNILYATDFSAVSLAAAPYALSFVKKFRARLTLLHVFGKYQRITAPGSANGKSPPSRTC
jgi:nucleotide-binding universal stress UspA family protein